MGMLYRRKNLDPNTGKKVERGPWWMKYYDAGKPIYESTEKMEKREAVVVVLKRVEARVAEGQREIPAVKRARFDDLIADLKNDYEIKGRKTWKRREQHIAHLKPVFGGMRAKAITSSRIQSYIAKRLSEGSSNATINRELDCLRRMMVLGQRQTPPKVGLIPHFPKLVEDNVREGFFEHDEFLALRGTAPDHIKVAMTIAYYTGMRLREIISANGLQWDRDVDFTNNCLRLSPKQTKTKKPRVIYMAGDFLKVMLKAKVLRDRDNPYTPVCLSFAWEAV